MSLGYRNENITIKLQLEDLPWSIYFDLSSFTKRMKPEKCQTTECKKHQKNIAERSDKTKKILPLPTFLLTNFQY